MLSSLGMKTNYDSMDEAFASLIAYVSENDEDQNDLPDLAFTARPTMSIFDLQVEEY